MNSKKTTKAKMFFLVVCCIFYTTMYAQDFHSIYKLCEAKKYKEAVPLLRDFIKKEPKHVGAHYELTKGYIYFYSLLAEQQNQNIANQNKDLWTDNDYQNNLQLWKDAIKYTDSIIYFYSETSHLMNVRFLTLDLRYNEFADAIKDCSVIEQVKCARAYIAGEISKAEKLNANNKSNLYNVEKNYENFKKDSQAQANSKLIKYLGSYQSQVDMDGYIGIKLFLIGSDIIGDYEIEVNDEVTATVQKKKIPLKNIVIDSGNGTLKFTIDNIEYYGRYTDTGIEKIRYDGQRFLESLAKVK